jgi:SAM-dependent methyltransferase
MARTDRTVFSWGWAIRVAAVLAAALAAVLAAMAGALAAAEPSDGPSERDGARQILDATAIRGGLVVHVGCGDGKLTAALRASDAYLVHGLDADAGNVRAARQHVRSLGRYGPVSVDSFDGKRLPYVDNLVNLVVAEDLGRLSMGEVMRVLAPNGAAYVGEDGHWTRSVKPRPGEIDEWTHYLHDASNNAVAHDTVVGPPPAAGGYTWPPRAATSFAWGAPELLPASRQPWGSRS